MSAVDVLAVMDRLDRMAEKRRLAYSVRDDIAKARDAMAELLAADAEFDAANAHLQRCPQPLSLNASGLRKKALRDEAMARLRVAGPRRAAALARCKGEGA